MASSGPYAHPGATTQVLVQGGREPKGPGSLVTALLLFGSSIENGSGSGRACVQGRKYTNEEGAKETTFPPSLAWAWGVGLPGAHAINMVRAPGKGRRDTAGVGDQVG